MKRVSNETYLFIQLLSERLKAKRAQIRKELDGSTIGYSSAAIGKLEGILSGLETATQYLAEIKTQIEER